MQHLSRGHLDHFNCNKEITALAESVIDPWVNQFPRLALGGTVLGPGILYCLCNETKAIFLKAPMACDSLLVNRSTVNCPHNEAGLTRQLHIAHVWVMGWSYGAPGWKRSSTSSLDCQSFSPGSKSNREVWIWVRAATRPGPSIGSNSLHDLPLQARGELYIAHCCWSNIPRNPLKEGRDKEGMKSDWDLPCLHETNLKEVGAKPKWGAFGMGMKSSRV